MRDLAGILCGIVAEVRVRFNSLTLYNKNIVFVDSSSRFILFKEMLGPIVVFFSSLKFVGFVEAYVYIFFSHKLQ